MKAWRMEVGILEGRSFELGIKLTSRSERLVWEMKASDQFLRARGSFLQITGDQS